jgi:hypothetical protein
MPSRSLCLPTQTLRIFQKIILAGSEDSDIKHMAVLIILKFLDFEQVSVDSEMPILGQPPSAYLTLQGSGKNTC